MDELKEKQMASVCQIAIEIAADLVNQACAATGARAISIGEGEINLTFAVPPEVMEKVDGNPKITVEELMTIPWSRRWSEEILKMTHPEWGAYPEPKKEELMRGLIERKLLPKIRKKAR